MKKKIQALLIIGSLGAMCAGLAACSKETDVDRYFKKGNVIMVTYDVSGGKMLGDDHAAIMDMFNPEKYPMDSEGYVHIKLRSPTSRKYGGGDVKVERVGGYSLAGWYKTRELVKDDEGNVLDEEGNKLVEKNENYYKVTVTDEGEEKSEWTIPAYTFSDPWDFATDTVDFKVGDEKFEMTLYAAWVPLFKFEYYYKPNEASDWTKYAQDEGFDYTKTEKADTVFVPDWSNETGKMEHKHGGYTFPGLENMTFKAAYSDPDCKNEITLENPLRHAGYIERETATAIGVLQPVYVQFDKGNYYRVSTAQQFADINDPTGYFTILSDELDFGCSVDYDKGGELSFVKTETYSPIRWPAKLTTSTFTGKIEGEGGKKVTFKNVGVQYSQDTSSNNTVLFGGLFGEIGEEAVLKNVSFEKVIFDIKKATSRRGGSIGMLAGNIDDDATLENVGVSGEMRLFDINISGGTFNFNLVANGATTGVTKGKIKLVVCGTELVGSKGTYQFNIDPDSVTVDEKGVIDFSIVNQNSRYQEKQYFIVYGGE